jgi:hypothetical protein
VDFERPLPDNSSREARYVREAGVAAMWMIALIAVVVIAAVGSLLWWLAGRQDPRIVGRGHAYRQAESDRRLADGTKNAGQLGV